MLNLVCAIAIVPCCVRSNELRAASPAGWASLAPQPGLTDWRGAHEHWRIAGNVTVEPAKSQHIRITSGQGVLVSDGEGVNLESKEDYQDVDVRLEFLIPQGSNSGVKLMGRYEIQILDTYGVKELSGDVCGGIYPRAEELPSYHHIDRGVAPRVNAAKPAGEWQRLEIEFIAPRFNASGKKTSNAKFARVMLNGQLIHENVEVSAPTGAAWRLVPEVPLGPLLMQGDHGPVAFRKIEVRRHN
jgi:hypothetical protein